MSIEMAPVHETILDEATVSQLFFDIAHAAELLGVTFKSAGARRADPVTGPPSLEVARNALAAGMASAVQLRYRFGGQEWWDTLVRTEGGVRLIRISHTQALATAGRP